MPENRTADQLRSALQDTPGLTSAYLFGSVAEGREHRESDVDIAVLLDWATYPTARARFERRLDLIAALRSAAHREIDLLVLNDAPPRLARRIMTAGQRLVTTDAEQDHAHLRVVLSRAADLEPFLRRTRAIKLQAIAP